MIYEIYKQLNKTILFMIRDIANISVPRLVNSLNEQYIRNYIAEIITMKGSYIILLPYFFIQKTHHFHLILVQKVGYGLTNVKPKNAIRKRSNMFIP